MTDGQTASQMNDTERASARLLKRALIAWSATIIAILIFRWFPDMWSPLRTTLAFIAMILTFIALSLTFSWHEHRDIARSNRLSDK